MGRFQTRRVLPYPNLPVPYGSATIAAVQTPAHPNHCLDMFGKSLMDMNVELI